MLVRIGLILVSLVLIEASNSEKNVKQQINPCCSNPCQNGGICMTKGFADYTCDCGALPYYGKHCETPTWARWLASKIRPSPDVMHRITTSYEPLWRLVNGWTWLHDGFMRFVLIDRFGKVDLPAPFSADKAYTTVDTYFNQSTFTRALPPVPVNCPTPMGTKGKAVLPDPDEIARELFTRKKFIPDSINTNVFFGFFAQHFTHMFFKTDASKGPAYTWGRHGVDVSNIYGPNLETEKLLRSSVGGKLKMQEIKGEMWPMFTKDIPGIKMTKWPGLESKLDFALGHSFFSILPGMTLISTIWMREHNRVAGILEQEHPEWDDEQIFQTAKLIILGETIKIVIEDYVQHLSSYKFKLTYDPALLHGEPLQYQNRIFVEFNHLYRWHPLTPDTFKITNTEYTIQELISDGTELLLKYGLASFLKSLIAQPAGQIGPRNHGVYTLGVVKSVLHEGRELRLQSFNEYRKKYLLKPYESFQELTGDSELAAKLERMYGDIDAVEYFTGIMLEKQRPSALFGGTAVEMGGPYSLQGLYANPIGSPKYWRPSTFGGDVGFDIVKTASLEKLFCANIKKGDCPKMSFAVQKDDAASSVKEEL
ncbi:prostaglandin G/H synthase 2-like [Tubulanus polymorphus]|uniref:prostaglandin G/H synthase 2-like n=1 Tax=Tubulanus polymorphus TaxID=672921 RepID=UPI003DA2A57A